MARALAVSLLAFDVGGTHVRGARCEELGSFSERVDAPTPVAGEALLELLVRVARELDPDGEAEGLGLAMAGVLDVPAGVVVHSPSLELRDLPLGPRLSERLGCPVVLVNDVNAAALGEARAADCADLAALFVGTGVGTGFVSGGRLLEGARGMAGEGGHLVHQRGGRAGPAGVTGCFEAYLGGRCLGQRAAERGLGSTARELFDAWRSGSELASELVEEALEAMSALAQLTVNLFDPAQIVLGGGVLEGLPELLEAARRGVRENPLGEGRPEVLVSTARLGDAAGLHGAAARVAASTS